MKIDCPHCGVHGSVNDSLAGRKLRCPKCSKVFLITEDIPPEVDDVGIVHQEILYDDKPQISGIVEQETLETEEAADPEGVAEPEEEKIAVEIEEPEETIEELEEPDVIEDPEEVPLEDDSTLEECSVCNQSFVPEFMVEIDSKLYCALCQPDSEEGLELLDETESEEEPDDEEIEEIPVATEDEGLNALMGDESEDDSREDDDKLLALMADEDDAWSDEETLKLQVCSGCGESLHPDFLEQVGSKHYCALCTPEEADGVDEAPEENEEEGVEIEEAEELALTEDGELLEEKTNSSEQNLMEATEDGDEEESPKEPCSVCGERFHRDFMQEVDAKLYCGVCQPEVIEMLSDDEIAEESDTETVVVETDEEHFGGGVDFTIAELIKEAWQKNKGAKASLWGGIIVMYLIAFTVSFGGMAASQAFYKGSDPTLLVGVNSALQIVSSWLSMLMTGGLMLIGVRRALEQRVSWKMVFAGFSKAASMTMAIILQSVLVVIGFILLVLPGIYLSVGYALTLPLILDKGMGPWEALEASRKAIHKKWWSVFGLYLVMLLIFILAAIPLGLGLIWVVPMYFVLIGVLYARLFCFCEGDAEDLEEDLTEEYEEDYEEDSEEGFDDEEEQEELLEDPEKLK